MGNFRWNKNNKDHNLLIDKLNNDNNLREKYNVFMESYKKCNQKITNNYIRPKLLSFVIYNVPGNWWDIILKYKGSNALTKERFLDFYGPDEGLLRWESYRRKQAVTNTFEYKNKKYGMSKQEFDEYNNSRAVTKNNLVKRHGEEKGSLIFNEYRKKQSVNGCTLEYFIGKYGDIEGNKKYIELNEKKKQTLENYIKKYGNEDGFKKFNLYMQKISKNRKNFSKVSQECFWKVYNQIKDIFSKIYFGELNNEYGVYTKNGFFFLDFFIKDKNLAIEFNGDWHHGNPQIFNEDSIISFNRKASDVWKKDRLKIKSLSEFLGINVLVIWEKEYRNNPDEVVSKIIKYVEEN